MLFSDNFTTLRISDTEVDINVIHGGKGEPLLLLHGYPQTHVLWHRVAPDLAEHFHVICPDLRGYGDSSKPAGKPGHENYSKRVMAQDMVNVMTTLGYDEFSVAGHDRGARVTHRMALDFPEKIRRACVMDIVPTLHMFNTTDQHFATGYYHWFFLIQPDGLPERMIGADPAYYLHEKLKRWSAPGSVFCEEALDEYIRCFSEPAAIHASCEDYRAAATIDLQHDEADSGRKLECPLLVLWGDQGFIQRTYDVLNVWKKYAKSVQGHTLNCGHFLPEEAPDEVYSALLEFLNNE